LTLTTIAELVEGYELEKFFKVIKVIFIILNAHVSERN